MKIAVGKNDAEPPKTILCGFIFVGEFVDHKLSEGFHRPRGFGYGIFDLMEIPVSIPRIPAATAKGAPPRPLSRRQKFPSEAQKR